MRLIIRMNLSEQPLAMRRPASARVWCGGLLLAISPAYYGARAAGPANAVDRAAPLAVRVLIINMFSLEAAPWLDALKPTREIRVPGLSSDYPFVKCRADAHRKSPDMKNGARGKRYQR